MEQGRHSRELPQALQRKREKIIVVAFIVSQHYFWLILGRFYHKILACVTKKSSTEGFQGRHITPMNPR